MHITKSFTGENDLIKGCLKGDRKAQRQLYDQYSGNFLSICIRYVKDRDLAEDVMIEGFMIIFENLSQFEKKGSFEGWMKRIIVNQSLLTLRKNKKLAMEIDLDHHEELTAANGEFDHFETEELLKMVAALPVGYRTVFNLYAIEGYSHHEIHEMLDISENTSKSQLSRARALLKNKLVQHQINERRSNG